MKLQFSNLQILLKWIKKEWKKEKDNLIQPHTQNFLGFFSARNAVITEALENHHEILAKKR